MHLLSKWAVGLTAAVVFPTLAFSAPLKPVFGWTERGALLPEQALVKVELDTSAEKSSLMAGHIEPFERNGESWVRFTLQVPKALTGTLVDTPFERKVVRSEKSKGVIGGGGHRQVVSMSLCIGTQLYTEELLLKNQGKKDFAVVLGRDVLQRMGPVDAGRINSVEPNCQGHAAQ